MKILVDIGHPAHVHFFRRTIRRLEELDHEVVVTARAKDVTLALLDAFGIPYLELSSIRGGRMGMAREFLERSGALIRAVRRFRPDVITAVGGVFVAPVGALTRTPSVVFTDTEHVRVDRYLTNPFASRICTPAVFRKDLGPRQVRYDGFHELAYLTGDARPPNHELLGRLGLAEGEPFSLLRFVSWQASHDLGYQGLSDAAKERVVAALERHGRVWISAEGPPPASLADRVLAIAPHEIHDLLAMARLYFGEGATMATEAALLGTPAVYVSPLVGTMGNFEALRAEGLVRSFQDGAAAQEAAEQLLGDPGAKADWQARAQEFIKLRANVSDFVLGQLLEIGAPKAHRGWR